MGGVEFEQAMHDEPSRVVRPESTPPVVVRESWTEQRITGLVYRIGLLVCIVGAAVTLGALVTPWAGWVAGAVAFGVLVVVQMRQDAETARQQQRPAAGRRFEMLPPRTGGGQG